MTSGYLAQWLEGLRDCCAQSPESTLYLIVDQAVTAQPLVPGIFDVVPCYSLFTGLPEAHAIEVAPLLIQVDLNEPMTWHWLSALVSERDPRTSMLALVSNWEMVELGPYLSRCLEARNSGFAGVLRFYDPRIFALLFSHVLSPPQQQPLLSPAVSWRWLDLDGAPQQMTGLDEPPLYSEELTPTELSDAQLETLACVSEALTFIGYPFGDSPAATGVEQRFQRCYAALLEATRGGVMGYTQRESLALNVLRKEPGQ